MKNTPCTARRFSPPEMAVENFKEEDIITTSGKDEIELPDVPFGDTTD